MNAGVITIAICTGIVFVSPLLGWWYDRRRWGHLDRD